MNSDHDANVKLITKAIEAKGHSWCIETTKNYLLQALDELCLGSRLVDLSRKVLEGNCDAAFLDATAQEIKPLGWDPRPRTEFVCALYFLILALQNKTIDLPGIKAPAEHAFLHALGAKDIDIYTALGITKIES